MVETMYAVEESSQAEGNVSGYQLLCCTGQEQVLGEGKGGGEGGL